MFGVRRKVLEGLLLPPAGSEIQVASSVAVKSREDLTAMGGQMRGLVDTSNAQAVVVRRNHLAPSFRSALRGGR